MPDLIIMTDEAGTNWGVPADPANSDYQAYLKSLEPEVAEEEKASEEELTEDVSE